MDETGIIQQKLDHIESILMQSKVVLTTTEMSKYTGLSKSYLYKLTSGGLIPYYKPNGKNIYFKKDEIDNWLLRGASATRAQQEIEANTFMVTKGKGGKHASK